MTANPYLAGNFAPLDDEISADELSVTGEIPKELNGRLLRPARVIVAAEPPETGIIVDLVVPSVASVMPVNGTQLTPGMPEITAKIEASPI